jgi:hypothetical protein
MKPHKFQRFLFLILASIFVLISVKYLGNTTSRIEFMPVAYGQDYAPLKEDIVPFAFPKAWGRLVQFDPSHMQMIFEANDGTIRFYTNRKRSDFWKFDEPQVLVIHRK